MSRQVIIIGGGITGLATAYALDREVANGHVDAVTLFEASPRLGGKILTELVGGFLIEGGPDSFVTLKPAAVEFADELGLKDRLVSTVEPRHIFILYRGRLEPLPNGLASLIPQGVGPFLRSRLFSPLEKARFAVDLLTPPNLDGADESLGAFVRRRLGQAAVDRLAGPLLAGIHAGDVEQLSLRATFPQLLEAESRHGSLTRAVQARRRSEAGGGTATMFMTLAGGLREMVDRVVSNLSHIRIRTGATVRGLDRHGSRYVVRLDGDDVAADAVVLAVPAGTAAFLLRRINPDGATVAASIPHVSTAVVALGFRRRDIGHPLAGHGYLVPAGERRVHTACTWVSSKWPGRAPDGHVLLRYFVGRANDQETLRLDDQELVSALLEDAAPLLGITGTPMLTRVYRWHDAMPQYTLGHLDRVAGLRTALTRTPGLIIAGAGYGGIGIPDCIRQGQAAAAEVLESPARTAQ